MREESVREERRESGENEDHRCVGGDARNPMIRSSMSSDMFYGVYGTNVMMTSAIIIIIVHQWIIPN